MHHITRRLSPSLIVALMALFVALAGTAVADVIISNSSQIAQDVITSGHIKNEGISNVDLKDPQLKLRVRFDGTKNGNGDGTVVRAPLEPKGVYDVTFNSPTLNGSTAKEPPDTVVSENCAITATARSAASPPASGSLDAAPAVFKIRPVGPNTVRVEAFERDSSEGLADTSFDIMASC
jgi:hypothetical protein